MNSRSSVVAAVLASVTLTGSLLAQQQSAPASAQRAADAVIPGAPTAIVLDIPTDVFAAQTAMRRVLDVAGVRYGLEGPAWDPKTPPLDFARTREDTLQLAGRRVGDALDAIVKAAPQFRWTEIDGVIVIRSSAAGQGILDREIPSFALTDAAPRTALEAVVAALDPARPRGLGIIGFGRSPTGAMGGPSKTGHNVTLNLRNMTVQVILASIARLNGELSWSVQYDRAPASLETATITLSEVGESVTAQSPVVFNAPISTASPAQTLRIAPSMPATLSNYARSTPVKISVEEVAVPNALASLIPSAASPSVAGVPPLELPTAPAEAIARIVALDSRYEWSEKNGRFRVRPKQGVPGRIDLLDQPMDGFTATNEPARTVIERVGRTMGTVRPASRSSARGPTSIDIAMATPISVSLAGPVTARDVLDAIADATGWSWGLRPIFTPGQPSVLGLQWRSLTPIPGTSTVSWSASVDVTTPDLSPAPLPAQGPVRAIPPSLDREIGRVTLSFDPGPDPFQQLAQEMRVPLTVEELPPPAPPQDPRRMTRPHQPVTVGPGRFIDAVYVLLEKVPGYDMEATNGMVNVVASSLMQSADYFMNRPLPAFSVNNVGLFKAVGELRRVLDPTFQPRDWDSGGAEILNRPVSLSVTNVSPRVILNRLVGQHGEVTWASSFTARDGADRTAPRVEDWIVTLTTISIQGPIVSLTAKGGVPASSLLPPFTPVPRSPVRAVILDLPVTSSTLHVALSSAGRILGIPIGFEGRLAAAPVMPFERSTDYYDLSGLQGDELVNKLRELAPDYEFSLANGVYHVRPRVAAADSTAWLDQHIDRFERQFENLRDAHTALATIGRPQTGMAGRAGPPPSTPPSLSQSPLNERLKKPLNISLTNTTVREILDEIARQFGSMMWSVDSRTTAQGTTTMSLTFSGYDGWSIGTGIR